MTHDNDATTAALSSAPAAREVVVCWEDTVTRHPVSKTALVVGRGSGCDVQVPHGAVSRRHLQIDLGAQGMLVEDLGSANGARLDGVPIRGRVPLALGAVVEIGAVRLLVRLRPSDTPSPMVELQRLVEKVAPTDLSVIVLGESGVGKEVLTEQIHARSNRSGPLVRLNCAGFTASLLESELFGYERGAFTGAVQSKPGLIESAEGGTVFLDELGEMPESTQPKLLRVLESREVRRIGALRARSVDVRFVSATHRDLRTLALVGKFREDLLFRLGGFTLRVPALRERRDEIPALAVLFLNGACDAARRTPPLLSEGALALLEGYRWGGNVRELRNVMHRAAILCDGPTVLVSHLDFDGSRGASVSEAPTPSTPAPGVASATPPLAAPVSEQERIAQALAKVGGNQAAAAKALGITPRVLAYRMDKLGMPRPRRA